MRSRHGGVLKTHTHKTHQHIHSMSDCTENIPPCGSCGQFTSQGFLPIWVKVRDLLMNVPNAADDHSCRLTSDGRGRLCYWSVLKNTALTRSRMYYILKNLKTYVLMHSCEARTHIPLTSTPTERRKCCLRCLQRHAGHSHT